MSNYYNAPAPLAQQTTPVHPHQGKAITGFILGMVGAIFSLMPLTFWIAIPCGALGLVFAAVGRKHGWGKWGIGLGIVAVTLGIYGAILINSAVNDVSNDLNNYSTCIDNSQTLEDMGKC